MRSPYTNLPPRAFWRTGVTSQEPESIAELYRPKFPITSRTRVATAGSCFAQHIAKHLRARAFSVVDAEPAPAGLDANSAAQFGFGLYSARYGNIYTARQLLQLFREAEGTFRPADFVWQKDGRYFDAMRPSVEPGGLSKADFVRNCRAYHLRHLPAIFETSDVFVFTLGLTETWMHAPSGTVYPTAPGTIAGCYDPAVHQFRNLTFQEVYGDLVEFIALAERQNPDLVFLLTVSPVPLTATATGNHVLAATTYSKSVLRAVAGQLSEERENVDYFPSYEIITGAQSRGRFFSDNLRSVTPQGVSAVMDVFFAAHGTGEIPLQPWPVDDTEQHASSPPSYNDEDEVVCEEILLDAFAG
ncbi:MAG TPA: GSCFA domain-containing protein [Rhizomicrobium sp.]|jgi:hypothetical protein|nr:GSCFA domain-containing protein [Rhizomicrobium sp.]